LLDEREEQQFLEEMLQRVQSYAPGWIPRENGSGRALVHIFARYLEILVERINQAPDKNKLAFPGPVGNQPDPGPGRPRPARIPAAALPGDGRVPAGSKAGAPVKGLPDPLVFETEADIALTQARLAEVVTVWPGRDAYADHSTAAMGHKAFQLFDPLQPVPHELYLRHDLHFALAGSSSVEVEFELGTPATVPLHIAWEYWDGEVWRSFKDFKPEDEEGESFDGTVGLTRSGIVRLETDCAETKPTKVHGVSGYWIRARLAQPLPRSPASSPSGGPHSDQHRHRPHH